MQYEPIIGMEVHAELLTASKMFCGCDAHIFGAPPNTHVCPVCLGLPGVLPVINRKAVEYTLMAGLALHCQIAEFSVFARKNYTYPDLPKGYQISQYELPLCRDGWLDVEVDGQSRRIGITRAHLEEDTAKLFHAGGYSLVDFNRAGVPLLEIVSEPDIRSPEEARQYLIRLQQILRYLGVSSADMEKGAMRCEANVSLRPVGSTALGTKVEVKNLNSFRSVKLALEYEIERQARVLEAGGTVEQVTMGWDEVHNRTVVQRSKEYADDYRYFPEPDLPPLEISREWVAEIRSRLPELPEAKRARFIADYGLDAQQAEVLVQERAVADYFEEAVAAYGGAARAVAPWISGELFRLLRAQGLEMAEVPVPAKALADLLILIDEGKITSGTGKQVLAQMFASGRSAAEIVEAEGLAQVSDAATLEAAVRKVLAAYPDEVAKYREGKSQIIGWLMGQVMRETKGKANPQLVRELLERQLRQC
ncbi:MAG: Asp-tRNA(Asn)/Glu-tRNA(Gln) amidotransferase subunit GatB [Anaerolineae bacterium]|nr:Asp-tRNA(Asn)/Glu-tRNA(Gln) amidotransferase subunit GatB [Anaerolineae bacterium]